MIYQALWQLLNNDIWTAKLAISGASLLKLNFHTPRANKIVIRNKNGATESTFFTARNCTTIGTKSFCQTWWRMCARLKVFAAQSIPIKDNEPLSDLKWMSQVKRFDFITILLIYIIYEHRIFQVQFNYIAYNDHERVITSTKICIFVRTSTDW